MSLSSAVISRGERSGGLPGDGDGGCGGKALGRPCTGSWSVKV